MLPPSFPIDLDRCEALIFDCDGTLADTMPAHFAAWSAIAAKYGLSFPEDDFYALGGVPANRILARLSAEQNVPLDPEAVAHEKEQLFVDRYLDHVRPIEPVAAVARHYHRKTPLAVATGGFRAIIHRCLGNLDLLHLFDAVVAAEDVQHHKPAPDTYLEAARRLGRDPRRCCAFEDTDIGLASARSAGMFTVDVRQILASPRPANPPRE